MSKATAFNDAAWEIHPAKTGVHEESHGWLSTMVNSAEKEIGIDPSAPLPDEVILQLVENGWKAPTAANAVVENAMKRAVEFRDPDCVAFAVNPKVGVQFFNAKSVKQGLAEHADWTTYVWSDELFKADLAKKAAEKEAEKEQADKDKADAEALPGVTPKEPQNGNKLSVISGRDYVSREDRKNKSSLDGRKEQKSRLKHLVENDLNELKTVLATSHRKEDDATDAAMRSFYREKYKGRYMMPCSSFENGVNEGYEEEMESAYSPTRRQLASPGGGSSVTSGAPPSATGSQRSQASGSAPNSPSKWDAKVARSPGRGSTFVYQYANDHDHRGPPYVFNNSSKISPR